MTKYNMTYDEKLKDLFIGHLNKLRMNLTQVQLGIDDLWDEVERRFNQEGKNGKVQKGTGRRKKR